MSEYHKIQSIYKRDPDTKYKTFLIGEYSVPQFELLRDIPWVAEEKLDGTNIRVLFSESGGISFRGRTDRAQIPPHLLERLNSLIDPELMSNTFNAGADVVLYGEGIGPKIQKDGHLYGEECDFVLFDVLVNGVYLPREAVKDIGGALGINTAPVVAEGTLDYLVELVRTGFSSKWGDFRAEGVIARPKMELKTRRGSRIITKIKCTDFDLE